MQVQVQVQVQASNGVEGRNKKMEERSGDGASSGVLQCSSNSYVRKDPTRSYLT